MTNRAFLAGAALCCSSLLLFGCQPGGPIAEIEISEAWAPATPPGASVGAAYMHISANSADVLTAAFSPLVSNIEVHETVHEEGVAKMRRIDPLQIAPGAPLQMEPGGKHFMLIGLRSPLEENTRLPLTLRFEQAGKIEIEVQVTSVDANAATH